MILDNIKELTTNSWMAVTVPDQRIFGLYLVSALVIAFLSYLYFRNKDAAQRPANIKKGFFAFVFDKDVYLHPSAKQDYLYFLVNGLVYTGIIAQLLISAHFFMMLFHSTLEGAFGIQDGAVITPSLGSLAIYTFAYVLFLDFAIYITHYAQHKIPVLWEFHKVHHSAEVLTPITLYRMHPVDLFTTGLVSSVLIGGLLALFYYLTAEVPQFYEVIGLNVLLLLFYALGYNLRHSHIWVNYPGWLSHILVSPAQHQIHHSTAPKHFDKNMGLVFSFWDWGFKTLYVPKKFEKITYGLDKKNPNPFNSVLDLYVQPFKKAWKIIYPDKEAKQSAITMGFIFIFCLGNYALFFTLDRANAHNNQALPSVHMEDLTWTEIQRSQDQGYDTVIIPTAGTEQNGAHVVLGKHYYVVRHTSGAIASKLGKTLVAPVIAYVPEDIHMKFTGTISIPEELFEGLLEATAESYMAHGFKKILFIGDSFGNQDAQEKVARDLSKRWKKDGVTVAHIGEYYDANNQLGWLMSQGYAKLQVGGHAGIRDTSEMLLIHPDGVRSNPVFIEGREQGHNGNYTLASKKLGETMVELKVDAALKQIRAIFDSKVIEVP